MRSTRAINHWFQSGCEHCVQHVFEEYSSFEGGYCLRSSEPRRTDRDQFINVVVTRMIENVATSQQAPHAVSDDVDFNSRIKLAHAFDIACQKFGVVRVAFGPIVWEYK